AQYVGSASIGDGITFAARRADREVIVGIAVLRPEQLEPGIDNLFRPGERSIVQPGNMRTARSDIEYFIAAHSYHASPGDADHPDIERIHVGVVTAYLGMLDRGPAVADHADIRAGPAHLEIDAVGYAQVH